MFKGANYKTNNNSHHHNAYGWDCCKVLEVSHKRDSVTLYCYSKEKKPNEMQKHIIDLGIHEFLEYFQMVYDLDSIDGVTDAQ